MNKYEAMREHAKSLNLLSNGASYSLYKSDGEFVASRMYVCHGHLHNYTNDYITYLVETTNIYCSDTAIKKQREDFAIEWWDTLLKHHPLNYLTDQRSGKNAFKNGILVHTDRGGALDLRAFCMMLRLPKERTRQYKVWERVKQLTDCPKQRLYSMLFFWYCSERDAIIPHYLNDHIPYWPEANQDVISKLFDGFKKHPGASYYRGGYRGEVKNHFSPGYENTEVFRNLMRNVPTSLEEFIQRLKGEV